MAVMNVNEVKNRYWMAYAEINEIVALGAFSSYLMGNRFSDLPENWQTAIFRRFQASNWFMAKMLKASVMVKV